MATESPESNLSDHPGEARSGNVVGGAKFSFLLPPVAITVFSWEERADGEVESGCRVEIQHLDETLNGTYGAAPDYAIGAPIWRGDFFTLHGGRPGNTDRAHYHVEFVGQDPGERIFDEELRADPLAWFEHQLDDLTALLTRCGCESVPDEEAVRRVAAPALAAVKACLPG